MKKWIKRPGLKVKKVEINAGWEWIVIGFLETIFFATDVVPIICIILAKMP